MPTHLARLGNERQRPLNTARSVSPDATGQQSVRLPLARQIEYLQRVVGNQVVMRLIAENAIVPVSNSGSVQRMMESDDEDGDEFYDDSMNTLPRLTAAIAAAMESDDGGHLVDDATGIPGIAHEYRDKPVHTVARRANVNAMAGALAQAILAADGGSVTNFSGRQKNRGWKQLDLGGGTATDPKYRAGSAGTGWLIRTGTATATPLVAVSIQSIQMKTYRQEGMLSPSFTFEITRLHWMPHHT
jgi:hypothetical protein